MKLIVISLVLLLSVLANATVKIAVIDTGIQQNLELPLCKFGHKSFFGDISDEHGHGSLVTQLINAEVKGEHKDYCFVIIKVFGYVNGRLTERFIDGVIYASKLDVDFVNISGGGYSLLPDPPEQNAINKLLDKGTIIVTAAGNDNKTLDFKNECNYYPACYTDRNIIVASSDTKSNVGPAVDVYLSGKVLLDKKLFQGSSFATARATGGLVRVMLKKSNK